VRVVEQIRRHVAKEISAFPDYLALMAVARSAEIAMRYAAKVTINAYPENVATRSRKSVQNAVATNRYVVRMTNVQLGFHVVAQAYANYVVLTVRHAVMGKINVWLEIFAIS